MGLEAYYYIGFVAISYLLLLYYMIRFVLRYKHDVESSGPITAITIVCLSVVLIGAALLPVDIFMASYVKESDGSFKPWASNQTLNDINATINGTYYTLYGIIFALMFLVLPFIHFFHDEDEYGGLNTFERTKKALIYTCIFTLVAGTLLLIGAFLPFSPHPTGDTIWNKIASIFARDKGKDALNLLMTVLTTMGMVNVAFYTAAGIFSWPIGLIRGTDSIAKYSDELGDREMILRMRVNRLTEKSNLTQLSPRERNQLNQAENELRTLAREEIAVNEYSNSLTYKLRKFVRPTQIVMGVVVFLLSLLIVTTLLINNLDRFMHGQGPRGGYILDKPCFINLMDYLFVKIQSFAVIGPLPILMITLFMIVATISGMRNLGLWLLCFKVHKIKIHKTSPHGLIFFCVSMILTVLAYNVLLYSLIPQFVTYGDQTYIHNETINGTIISTTRPCALEHTDVCIMTRTSVLLIRFMTQIWLFGSLFYWLSWVFIVVSILTLLVKFFQAKRSAVHGLISQEEEFEE